MYVIKVVKDCEKYFDILYMNKNGILTSDIKKSKKFLAKHYAKKYAEKHMKKNEYTVANYLEELKLISGNSRYVANKIIGIIENCKEKNTNYFKNVTNKFADTIIEEIKKEYEELFTDNI